MSGRLGRMAGLGAMVAVAAGAVLLVVAALPDGVTDTASTVTATSTSPTSPLSSTTPSPTSAGPTVTVPNLAISSTDTAAVTGQGDAEPPMTSPTASAPELTSPAITSSDDVTAPRPPERPEAPAPPATPLAPASPLAPSAPTPPPSPSLPTAPAPQTPPAAATSPSLPTLATTARTSPAPAPSMSSPVAPSAPAAPPKQAAAAPNAGIPITLGNATQVITVVAASPRATTATLHAWQRQANGSWTDVFGPVKAYVGSAGIGKASESTAHTPQGTFTLTQAFGALADPGTALPYRITGPNDWWVSDTKAASYNTWQTCAKAQCPFNTSVSEHLHSIRPYYDYAVVMDVNRSPAIPGGGSAFFLHVSVGAPTEGCVAIDKATLVKVLRWLDPTQHPRIATGVA